jgi:cap2 methyltransferase
MNKYKKYTYKKDTPKEILDVLNADTYELKHYVIDKILPFSPLLDWNGKSEKYVRRRNKVKYALHWGQLKLMLTEIEFLLLASKEYFDNKMTNKMIMVYAGAAPGDHIDYLSELFPHVYFELYDPNKFTIKPTDKIKIHTGVVDGFFTDKNAKYWKDSTDYIIFCSDIRTNTDDGTANEDDVKNNMELQYGWWKIMNPDLSMFKFRLPWSAGETEYPDGDVYIQPFPGATSTETRIIIKKDAPIVSYDNKLYEELLFYHNNVVRKHKFDSIFGDKLNITDDGIDNCFDCIRFLNLCKDYVLLDDKYHFNTNFDEDSKELSDGQRSRIKKLVRDIQEKIVHIKGTNILSKTIINHNKNLEIFYSDWSVSGKSNKEYNYHKKFGTVLYDKVTGKPIG